MGFFSWKTQDTNRSIPNFYSNRPTFPVTMTDNKGNKWTETRYEGYGIFDGKDFYELLAEMNGKESDRSEGIRLYYGDEPFLSPNLNENPNAKWINRTPEDCEFQGYFYDDEESEENSEDLEDEDSEDD
jgi:hypothetical protein